MSRVQNLVYQWCVDYETLLCNNNNIVTCRRGQCTGFLWKVQRSPLKGRFTSESWGWCTAWTLSCTQTESENIYHSERLWSCSLWTEFMRYTRIRCIAILCTVRPLWPPFWEVRASEPSIWPASCHNMLSVPFWKDCIFLPYFIFLYYFYTVLHLSRYMTTLSTQKKWCLSSEALTEIFSYSTEVIINCLWTQYLSWDVKCIFETYLISFKGHLWSICLAKKIVHLIIKPKLLSR